jgi:hypothetical protein
MKNPFNSVFPTKVEHAAKNKSPEQGTAWVPDLAKFTKEFLDYGKAVGFISVLGFTSSVFLTSCDSKPPVKNYDQDSGKFKQEVIERESKMTRLAKVDNAVMCDYVYKTLNGGPRDWHIVDEKTGSNIEILAYIYPGNKHDGSYEIERTEISKDKQDTIAEKITMYRDGVVAEYLSFKSADNVDREHIAHNKDHDEFVMGAHEMLAHDAALQYQYVRDFDMKDAKVKLPNEKDIRINKITDEEYAKHEGERVKQSHQVKGRADILLLLKSGRLS